MSPCAVTLHNAVTVPQQRLGKHVAHLSSAPTTEVYFALCFSLGCDSKVTGKSCQSPSFFSEALWSSSSRFFQTSSGILRKIFRTSGSN